MAGKLELLLPSTEHEGRKTLDLRVFAYENFLEFISVAQNLQNGSKKFTGKRPMSFSVFEHLCAASLGLPDCGFTHIYLVLSWNLMCRAESTETI
ncbi:hypothetical protein DYB31_013762, partial [Aphanomyces astaci]